MNLRVLPILIVTSCLGACTSLQGVLVPVSERATGTQQVDMLVATTRQRTEPAEMFSGARGSALSFANIRVSIPPASARQVGEVQWPQRTPGDPTKEFVTTKADVIDRTRALAWYHRAVRTVPKRRVLVFIHGFNNRFEDAVLRFAQIVHDADAPAVPVLFTWPSRGSVLAYGYDRESTTYSRNALESVLRDLSQDPAVGEISILAHSMGNSLALETLRQMAIRDGRVAPKIRNVLLAAPDVDVDLAREAIIDMGPKERRPSFTLFVSQDDKALAFSKGIWGGGARLGAINPDAEPYRTDLAHSGVNVVDLTKLRAGDSLNHGKFAQSPEIVQLIGRRLAEGQTVTDSRVGLGDRIVQVTAGAAGAAGTAAGLVLSAPIAIVDPQTRSTMGGHVEAIGRGVADTVRPW